MIHELETHLDVWDIIFVKEFDGFTCEREVSCSWGHSIYRHWPGPGSFSIAFIVHSRVRHLLKSIVPHGRAMSAYFKDDMALDLLVIGAHGGHGDALHDSLANISYLLRSGSRLSRKLVIGDHNIDILPTLPSDPWASLPHRSLRHQYERQLLNSFCLRSRLAVNVPDRAGPPLTGPWKDFNTSTSFSRVPIGDQYGLPSLIDFALGTCGVVLSSYVLWNSFSDHAYLVCRTQAPTRLLPRRPKRTWEYKNWDDSVHFFASLAPEDFESFEHFLQHVCQMQKATGAKSTCKQRSRCREPPAIKLLRQHIRQNTDPTKDRSLKKSLWEARKSWLSSLQAARDTHVLSAGKPITKRKKLTPITSMKNGCSSTIDFGIIGKLVGEEFEAKWKTHDLHRRSLILDELAKLSSSSCDHSWDDFMSAACVPAKQRRTDDSGMCLAALRIALQGSPQATARLLNRLLCDDGFFKSQTVSGQAYAKKTGTIEARQVRAITPLSTTMVLFDCLIDQHLTKQVDSFALTVGSGYMETAIRGRQILDATFALSQHVEKTLDMHSHGCIAAADIMAYFDHLDPLRIARWLLKENFPPHLVAALLRLHCLPQITLSVSRTSSPFCIRYRTNGFFTGTRTAGTASRIPLLDAALSRLRIWNETSACYNGVSFSLVSFVDNVFTTGHDAFDATSILNDLERHLSNKWRLKFGGDSKEILPTAGCDLQAIHAGALSDWQLRRSMRCLGHIISDNGSIGDDFEHAKATMWAAFWANYRPGLLNATKHTKINFLQRCVRPIAAFKWSRWPFQRTYGKKLDQIQTHMLQLLFPLPSRLNESADDFFRRKSLVSGRLANSLGRWSASWALSVRRWHDHCVRAHDSNNWCSAIYAVHGEPWIQAMRARHCRGAETNRTGTRVLQAKPTRRWYEGYNDSLV